MRGRGEERGCVSRLPLGPDLTCSTLLRTAQQRHKTNGRGGEEPGVLEGASGRTKRGKVLWVSERVRRGSAGPLG